jgi:hypothetical protein
MKSTKIQKKKAKQAIFLLIALVVVSSCVTYTDNDGKTELQGISELRILTRVDLEYRLVYSKSVIELPPFYKLKLDDRDICKADDFSATCSPFPCEITMNRDLVKKGELEEVPTGSILLNFK